MKFRFLTWFLKYRLNETFNFWCFSAKAGAHETAPPYSWTGEVLELGAVQQVLASLLAFWPVQGWTPALMPRLFGSNSTSLPMEPTEACSVICLLVCDLFNYFWWISLNVMLNMSRSLKF